LSFQLGYIESDKDIPAGTAKLWEKLKILRHISTTNQTGLKPELKIAFTECKRFEDARCI
jgi:hypothetical protein